MLHSDFSGGWLCGPGGLLPGFHFGGLLHLLAWGVGLFLLYKLIRTLGGDRQKTATAAGASESLAILERRYASGEIDQEEFLRKKKDLGG